MIESISNPEGFHADPVLIGLFSATLDEEELEVSGGEGGENSTPGRSRREHFLKSMEDKLDPKNTEQDSC